MGILGLKGSGGVTFEKEKTYTKWLCKALLQVYHLKFEEWDSGYKRGGGRGSVLQKGRTRLQETGPRITAWQKLWVENKRLDLDLAG